MRFFRVVIALLLLGGCDDPVSPRLIGREFGVVLSSVDRVLTVFSVDSPSAPLAIGLGPEGTPVSLAVRGSLAAVPLGIFPALAVVDLVGQEVLRTVPLPTNSGATGVAFLNDSIALVGNPGLNSVTPVNVLRGTSQPAIPVGVFPQSIVTSGDTAFVLNAELVDFVPAGNGTISVITDSPLRVVRTIQLSGTNPGAATIGRDRLLYVLNSGSFAENNGSLSVVDRRTLQEVRSHTGFGEFPGSLTQAGDGRFYIAAYSYGLAVWDAGQQNFVRAPTAAVQPGGLGSAGVGVDGAGRLYSLKPECSDPAAAYRLDGAFAVTREVPVGICPTAIAFTRFEPLDP